MAQNKKVLQISNYYFPGIGGIEQVARDCAHALSGNAEQRVFCFNHARKTARDVIEGVPVTRAGCFAKVRSQSLSAGYYKLLKREFRAFGPDIVIFHYPNPFAAHALLKILKKYPACKLVVWWHLDITKQKILGKLFRGQTLRLLERAEKIVATSPNYIEGSKFLPSFRDKCVVIPNCASAERVQADEEIFRRASELKAGLGGKTMLFALGRHVPYKGLEYLVRASKLLGDDYVVFIGGEGPLTQSLHELAREDGKIVFLGRMENEAVKEYLCACDIFCFPSVTKNEAFGIALAEALAYGKPAVTFRIEGSGVNYVSLSGVTGIEVANADIEQYAEAIERLAHDPSLRLQYGEAAKKRAEELFSEARFHQNVRALVEGVSCERS